MNIKQRHGFPSEIIQFTFAQIRFDIHTNSIE